MQAWQKRVSFSSGSKNDRSPWMSFIIATSPNLFVVVVSLFPSSVSISANTVYKFIPEIRGSRGLLAPGAGGKGGNNGSLG